MSVSVWIGIDPGLHGAIAVQTERCGPGRSFKCAYRPLPIREGCTGRQIDGRKLFTMLKEWIALEDEGMVLISIERAQALPDGFRGRKQGTVGMFNYGVNFGIVILAAEAQAGKAQVKFVPASAWKRAFLFPKGADKDESVRRARIQFKIKDSEPLSDGEAEALFISEYGRMKGE